MTYPPPRYDDVFYEGLKWLNEDEGIEMDKINVEATHLPTDQIQLIKGTHPYRIFCKLCRRPIVASETPIPEFLRKQFENTPCSKCVSPLDYARKLRRKK